MEAFFGAGTAIVVAAIAAWSARSVERTKRQAQRNTEMMEERRFSLEYHERTTAAAIKDADRLRIENLRLWRWAVAAQREHPELGDLYRYDPEPEDLDDQDVRGHLASHHDPGGDDRSGGEQLGPWLQLRADGEGV